MSSEGLIEPTPPARTDFTLTNLQGLRAVAALGVVLFHFGLMPPTALPFHVGASGVDIFFVLSGFIIAQSSSRSPRHFLAHRLIRVLPAYWIVTLVAALFTLQNINVAEARDWLVQSLFYLPHPAGRPPLIFVAWTLIYELAFYLLYWLALRTGTRRAPWIALAALLPLALVPMPGLAGPWPLLLEFAFGILIYLLVERHRFGGVISGWAGLLGAGIGFALLLVLPEITRYGPDDSENLRRVMAWGVPAALIVLGLVLAERGGLALRNRIVLRLGAASYAIYLLHPVAVGQLLQLPPISPPVSWALCVMAAAATAAIALAFHLLVELPLLRRLRGMLRDPMPVEQHASAGTMPRLLD